jgi:hypothetical protein
MEIFTSHRCLLLSLYLLPLFYITKAKTGWQRQKYPFRMEEVGRGTGRILFSGRAEGKLHTLVY